MSDYGPSGRRGQTPERHTDRRAIGLDVVRDVLYPSAHPEAGRLVPAGYAAVTSESPWRTGTGPGTSVPPMARLHSRFLCGVCGAAAVTHDITSGHDPELVQVPRVPGVHHSIETEGRVTNQDRAYRPRPR